MFLYTKSPIAASTNTSGNVLKTDEDGMNAITPKKVTIPLISIFMPKNSALLFFSITFPFKTYIVYSLHPQLSFVNTVYIINMPQRYILIMQSTPKIKTSANKSTTVSL